MQYIRCNSFFDHCTDQPDNIYKGYMWLLSYLRREYTGTRLSVWLCHILLLFSVQFHLLVNLSVISIPQSHFRLQPWETCEMGMGVPPSNGTKCKACFRIFEWFLPVLPNHSGIVCFFKVPGQLVLWIVIKVDKLEDTRGTSRLTNSRQILLTHFSKSIRLMVWHQPGQMDKLNSICGNLNTYKYWHLIEKSRVTEPEEIHHCHKISSKFNTLSSWLTTML